MLSLAQKVLAELTPETSAMTQALDEGHGLIHAEALSFALAEWMPRPEAQAVVKEMCGEATATNTQLLTLAARLYPQINWKDRLAATGLGQAPTEALAFAARVRGD